MKRVGGKVETQPSVGVSHDPTCFLDEIDPAGNPPFLRSKEASGLLIDLPGLISPKDRLVERSPTKGRTGFDDLVETAIFGFTKRNRFTGAQVVTHDFEEQLAAPINLWGQPLADYVAKAVRQTNT